jgi:prepilin-type N-terminal cleavage/methylation domain
MRLKSDSGFTLIELLVVMSIIAILLTIALPRYLHSIDKARETALRQDLAVMRDALDKYHGDKGKYPDNLEELVTERYLRSIPSDPLTGSYSTWVTLPPGDTSKGLIYDIRSGALSNSSDGTPYKDW